MFTRYRLLAALAALIAAAFLITPAGAQPVPQSVFGDTVPARPVDPESKKVELGTRFTVAKDGLVTAVRFYKGNGNTGTHVGKLYAGNREVARVTFTNETGTGWQTAKLTSAVAVKPGTTYTVSYVALRGKYASDEGYAWPKVSGDLTATGGYYRYPEGYPTQQYNRTNYYVDVLFTANAPAPTTTTPAPTTTVAPPTTTTVPPTTTTPPSTTVPPTTTTTPPGPAAWPGPDNTGVPAGKTLTPYSGPTRITAANTVIDSKTINSDLVIAAAGVRITNTRMVGHIDVDCGGCSLTVEDSEVNYPSVFLGPTIGYHNVTVRRSEIVGGGASINCGNNCLVEDSWLHGQLSVGDSHNNAYLSNGGSNVTLRHNTLDCSAPDNGVGGGCSADASFFGDFAPIANITIDNNLYVASASSGYCGYFGWNPGKAFGDNPTNVKVTNNVVQRGPNGKCGIWGPDTSFKPSGAGNVWTGNKWDDGTPWNHS